jgi:ketosteroid isomerase-like protein
MGEACEVMDRVTETLFGHDWDAALELYAADAVAATPDAGEVRGPAEIVAWAKEFMDAFPDASFELENGYEDGNTAIDEGYFVGTNTGPLEGPDGEEIPPTGKSVRVRSCDIATIENGVVTSHRFYFDHADFFGQLGLAEGPG